MSIKSSLYWIVTNVTTAGPPSSFQEQDNMGGHQGYRGLPALRGQTSCQQQRNCMLRQLLPFECTIFLADENWTEDPREEDLRCSHETDLLWTVCGWRGKKLPGCIWKSLDHWYFLYLECQDNRSDHRQNEELRGEEHPGLQRGGGHLSGGRGEHRDEVSILTELSHSNLPSSAPVWQTPM